MVSTVISSSTAADAEPFQTQSDPTCIALPDQVVFGSDEPNETRNGSTSTKAQVFRGSDGAATKFISADESVETLNGSTSIAKGEENL